MSFIEIFQEGDPSLVLLHGTGGDETQMAGLAPLLSKRMGFLSLRGKEPENGVNRWFRRFAEGVFDEPNLIMRTEELSQYVKGRLPSQRRIAVGISNGANIAGAALLLHPDTFDAAVLLAPMVPLSPDRLPDLTGKPVLMVCGERDSMVPRANAQALATMLSTAGADLTLHWHPGGHNFGMPELHVASAWLARVASWE